MESIVSHDDVIEVMEVTDRGLVLLLLRAVRAQSETLKEILMSQTTVTGEFAVLSGKVDTLQAAVSQFATDAAALLATVKAGTLSAEAMTAATALEAKIDALTTTVQSDDASITSGTTSSTTSSGTTDPTSGGVQNGGTATV